MVCRHTWTVSAVNTSVTGTMTCSGKLILGTYAVQQGYMASRTLTFGDTAVLQIGLQILLRYCLNVPIIPRLPSMMLGLL